MLLATEDFEEHRRLLKIFLTRLTSNARKLNINKCEFGCDKIDYFGYSVTATGISLGDSHIASTKKYPLPTNAKSSLDCFSTSDDSYRSSQD